MGSFNGCCVKEFYRKILCLRGHYYGFDMACFWIDMITSPFDSVLSLVHIVTDFIFSLLRFWSIDIWFSPLLSYHSFWMASYQSCEYPQFEQPAHHFSNLFFFYNSEWKVPESSASEIDQQELDCALLWLLSQKYGSVWTSIDTKVNFQFFKSFSFISIKYSDVCNRMTSQIIHSIWMTKPHWFHGEIWWRTETSIN